ncbi:MAG: SoxR reducing system RseC family protein [Crocinitomicaceae bacterium]|nr:SoxR reducing system RseC family protein [Crocinitomicaceae bacterium]
MLDTNINQYELNDQSLIINPPKSAIVPRFLMYFFAFISFITPVFALISTASSGSGLHIGNFISILIFGLIGFYLLRVALWNTYGKESMYFHKETISYEADYGWFKDKVKKIPTKGLTLSFQVVGYEEENKGVLVLTQNNQSIKCASKMPIDEIEILISELNKHIQFTSLTSQQK